jgi:inosine/xanthosine triphosphatase
MIFRVATKNKIKIKAVKKALHRFFNNPVVLPVNPCPTLRQPRTLFQTIICAKKRAKEAFSKNDISIGVEAGIWRVKSVGYINVCVCCIYDGRDYHFGFGPAFVLPKKITKEMLRKKSPLEHAVKKVLKIDPEKYGAIGAISKNRVKREEIIFYATLMALSHIKSQNNLIKKCADKILCHPISTLPPKR